jgi:hypothetical protein
MAGADPNAWLLVPTILLTLEVVIEKALLQCHAKGQVEPLFMAARMPFQPLLFGGRLNKGLKISAGV